MAVIYSAALKDARMALIRDAIDAGAAPGYLEIGTAGMGLVLAHLDLAHPCGLISGGILTLLSPLADTSATGTGNAAAARVKDGDGNIIISGLTVGTNATDIVISSTAIYGGQTLTISSATITHG